MSTTQRDPGRERQRRHERWSDPLRPRSLAPPILAVAAAFVLRLLHNVLLPFVIAAIVGYVCAPLVDWLTVRTRAPRWLMALCLLAALLGVAVVLGLIGLPPLVHRLQSVMTDLHGAVTAFTQALIGRRSISLLGSTLDAQHLADVIVGGLRNEMSGARILTLIGWTAAGAFGYVLAWVLVAYFLLDLPAITAGLLWLVPPGARARVGRVCRELDPILRRYFLGVAAVVAYATAAAYLGLELVLRLHHAAVLAVLTGMLEAFPVIGPVAAAVLAGLVAVQQATSSWDIEAYVCYVIALRLSIDQFIGPLVLGTAARVRPVVVIFSFLVGGVLFGIVGVILAVPFALTVKVTLSVLYDEPQYR